MKTGLRRIRGAVGMGLTWAAAWFGAGAIVVLGFLLTTGSRPDAPFPLLFGAFGFVAGVIFSGVVSLVEGRRRFDQMSLPRFAAWGAAGGFLLSAIFVLARPGRGLSVPMEPGGRGSHLRGCRRGLCRWFAGPGQKGQGPRVA